MNQLKINICAAIIASSSAKTRSANRRKRRVRQCLNAKSIMNMHTATRITPPPTSQKFRTAPRAYDPRTDPSTLAAINLRAHTQQRFLQGEKRSDSQQQRWRKQGYIDQPVNIPFHRLTFIHKPPRPPNSTQTIIHDRLCRTKHSRHSPG